MRNTPEATPEGASRPLSILVVDAESETREVITRLLSLVGHHPEAAADGNEAIRRFGARKFDLVLLELSLPGLRSIDFLWHLRRFGRTHQVIVIAADRAACIVAEALSLGVAGVLQKPFTFEQLGAEVDRIAQRLGGDVLRDLTRSAKCPSGTSREPRGPPP